jgi:hypothetical protein
VNKILIRVYKTSILTISLAFLILNMNITALRAGEMDAFRTGEVNALQAGGIPLEKGNYWLYKGRIKYVEPGVERPAEKSVALKMEITDIIIRDGVTAAVVKGYPLDLTGFDGFAAPRGNYLLVRAGHGSYYLLSGEDAINGLKKLKDNDDSLHELVDESDMIADFPLAVGKVFGEAEQVTRTDGKYFWRVEECVDADLSTVKGSPAGRVREYRLFYTTNPDRQTAGLVAGVGITNFSYRHNGTVMEFDVKLAECFINRTQK